MECNRDEAIRAKSIAEEKLEKKDFAGARKFALKAQSLYPQLDGLSQMLTTIDVYVSSDNKIGGEVDWYGVLGVSPSADDETLKKQYRKLALMLHPDKNKSAGADGAFKILCEAWSLLSDKYKRLAYNQRRFPKGFQQNVPVHASGPSAKVFQQNVPVYASGSSAKVFQQNVSVPKSGPSAPPRANGVHGYKSRPPAPPKTSHVNNRVAPSSANRPTYQRSDTFWTICHRCKMHYEYLKVYLNHTLLCPNCHDAFLASETSPPFNNPKSSIPSARPRPQNPSNNIPSSNVVNPGRNAAPAANDSRPGQTGNHSFAGLNVQQDPFSRNGGAGNVDPSIAAKAANVVQQAHEKMKRERDSSQSAAGNPAYQSASVGEGTYKRTRVGGEGYYYGANTTFNLSTGAGSSMSAPGRSGFEADRMRGYSGPSYTQPIPNSIRELGPVEVRNMLIRKAVKEIHQKLGEWQSQTSNKTVDSQKLKVNEGKNAQGTVKSRGCDQSGNVKSSATREAENAEEHDESSNAGDAENSVAIMSVPDSDFHDFDLDRTENSFEENEVWAAYDDQDGMPRFYALINKVISRNPFKLRINFLNSRVTTEFGTKKWVEYGFHKTCGEFRHGKLENSKSINSFSHKVKFSKGRGVIHIFPSKGDVWALYKNWSADWNEETPEEVIQKYDMVIVLDDYSEEHGIKVAPLTKVYGFKTVFLPHPDPDMVKQIPKQEMLRFSHQVPHYVLSGEDAQKVPKGSLELDPAATPLELLQVLGEAKDRNVPEERAEEKAAAAEPKIKEGEEPSMVVP
ncbi:hypothetical protein M9H77_26503 [Catharanthus roseus]|uniref:Uncharacterized protein n=1 Tax=Catharanthus roseus TaxID=4058 RepID=A0ACC0ABQ8_CATRO|nr:hypothetical protein M9H77_26503 [Catharanthus roseus]